MENCQHQVMTKSETRDQNPQSKDKPRRETIHVPESVREELIKGALEDLSELAQVTQDEGIEAGKIRAVVINDDLAVSGTQASSIVRGDATSVPLYQADDEITGHNQYAIPWMRYHTHLNINSPNLTSTDIEIGKDIHRERTVAIMGG